MHGALCMRANRLHVRRAYPVYPVNKFIACQLLVIMPSRIQILTLLILARVWLSTSQFVFELEVDIDSVTAGNFNCDTGLLDGDPQCHIYFPVFCLREGRGDSWFTNEEDCPLGRNTIRMNAYHQNYPNGNA